MTIKTILKPLKKHISEIEKWLIEERNNTGNGFYCNWNVIENAIQDKRIIVLTIDDFAIGFVTYRIDELIANIDIAEINPNYRKKGYGRKMINNCLNHFKKQGVLVTELYCEPKSSEKIWKKLDFINFPVFPHDNNKINMFRPLVERLEINTEVNETDEVVELWNEEPHIAERINPKWTWKINSSNLERPIIQPAFQDWQVRWRKGNIIKETDKVKRFFSKENQYGHFVIIKRLKNYKEN